MTPQTITVQTQQGDTVDLICWRQYGHKMQGSSVLEEVLHLNHGLADRCAVLPMGLTLTLPVLTSTNTAHADNKEVIQLWT